MELIRTSLLTGISTAVKLASAFVINKVVAVVAGPPGMALIGQVQNVTAILQGISSGLFGNAAVKYSAEWKSQPARLNDFLELSYTLVFWVTVAVGGGTAVLSWLLAKWLLNDAALWWVFALLGLTIPLFAANSLVLSVINGLGDVKKLTMFNIGQSVLGLVISAGLPLLFGLAGALAAVTLASAVVFVLLVPELKRHHWLKLRRIRAAVDRENLNRLKGFALMAVTSAVCAPLAQIMVREWIMERCSAQEAGYWQGLMRLSGAYLVFFSTTLGVYFLPKFSALDAVGIRKELRQGYAILLPAIAALFVLIWLARGLVIPLLFSLEFRPMEELLGYQLVGDFLKLGGWMMGYLLLARAQTWLFVVVEIGFSLFYVMLSMLLVGSGGQGGARGALVAWIVLYAGYWACMLLLLPLVLRGEGARDPATSAGR